MKTILLINPPFCTPASPPYSLSHLYTALKESCANEYGIKSLDLNLELHKRLSPEFAEYSKKFLEHYKKEEYESKAKNFIEKMKADCAESNKLIIKGSKPLLFNEMFELIMKHKPDITAFSLVYSSQTNYACALILELRKKGVKTIIGGPATSSALAKTADKFFSDYQKLIQYLTKNKTFEKNYIPDFKIWGESKYFTPETVIPLKTSTTCYYKKCSYCTHYSNEPYQEHTTKQVYETIKQIPGGRTVFLIDEMISKKRLLSLAEVFKKRNLTWACQLRPTKEYDKNTLKKLSDSGLKMIIWGVESGSDRILKLINKGTNTKDIKQVLSDSHKSGIKNVCYTLFGFPTETKEEFLKTLNFLKDNSQNIDLASTSVFGLQKNTPIYNNPEKYGIKKIIHHKRHYLDERLEYKQEIGLSRAQAKKLRYKYKKKLDAINKYPNSMNFFREHMLCLIKKENLN